MNQVTWAVLAVSFLSVIREKRWMPYLVVAAGSAVTGNIGVVLVSTLTLLYRNYFFHAKTLEAKDTVGILFMLSGASLPGAYHDLLMVLGVFIFSINLGRSRLPLLPPLLIVYDLFGSSISVELVLGAFAFYAVLSELLTLFKSSKKELILKLLEVPVLAVILSPFFVYLQNIAGSDLLVGFGAAVLVVLLLLFVWIKLKNPDFFKIYKMVEEKSVKILNPLYTFIGEERPLQIQEEEIEMKEGELGFRQYFNSVYFGLFLLFFCWIALVFFIKGGMS